MKHDTKQGRCKNWLINRAWELGKDISACELGLDHLRGLRELKALASAFLDDALVIRERIIETYWSAVREKE